NDRPHLQLAAHLPSQDDGSWVVNADGTMKTTYTLSADVKWQDGHPLTADDFVFANTVYTDDQIPTEDRIPESLVTGMVARDAQTLEISWRQPYLQAGALTLNEFVPLPRHLLGDLYAQHDGGFVTSTFWTGPDKVGSGPYRPTAWERGVEITLAANPYFPLGKPKIDTLHVLFVADANTVIARMLAGAVDVFPTATTQQALTLEEANGGQVFIPALKARRLYYQFRDVPGYQKAVQDIRVRQAFLHAIDREALANGVQGRLGVAADTAYPRAHLLFPRIDAAIAKYPYDVTRAQALLRDAGWTAGADGLLRDAGGNTLDAEIRSTDGQDSAIIADFWRRAGINSIPLTLNGQQKRDDEFRANFPATQIQSGNGFVTRLATASAPTAANRYRSPENRGTYSNPEYDRLYTLQLTTLDRAARDNVLIDIERLITTDVAAGYLMQDPSPLVVRSNVKGPVNGAREIGDPFWNISQWSVEG
ncbi:MAG: peptide/nickel transport system substrate-binding protein, partial [Chloroflexota bacterium]|nr:peptide/nickel transport system substrate-binding protein [Chloroflexota bacterium]